MNRKPFHEENPTCHQAWLSFLREDFDGAIGLLEDLAHEHPDRGEYLNDLAVCLYLAGDRQRSHEVLERARQRLGRFSAPAVNGAYLFRPRAVR